MDIGPYNLAQDITKHDTNNITRYITIGGPSGLTDAVYVGGAGVLVAVWEDGATSSFTCVAGQVLPVAIKRVNSTNTTATLMLALYRI